MTNATLSANSPQLSLQHPVEIIDEYVRQSFHTIFLRPISPYGFAIKSSHRTGYQMEAFLDFYRTGLHHILEINKKGYRALGADQVAALMTCSILVEFQELREH